MIIDGGTPYKIIFVAGNVHGCGEQYNSLAFFTEEQCKYYNIGYTTL